MRRFAFFRSSIIPILLCFLFIPAVWADSDRLIDLDFKNADLKDVLRALAFQKGVNFIIDNNISGSVTIRLTKVSFEDALNIITRSNSLAVSRENNIYRISFQDPSTLNMVYENGLLTLEAVNARLPQILSVLSQKSGRNYVPSPDLQDRLTIAFTRVPLGEGVQALLTQANCSAENNGSVIFVRKKISLPFTLAIQYQDNLLSLEATNVPLGSLARSIAEKTGVAVVANQELNQNISIYFQNLPLDQALNLLCNANNLELVKEGPAWRIAKGSYNPQNSNLRIVYDSQTQLFTLDIQGAALTTVLREMAVKANLNLVVLPQVNANINNLRLQKLNFTQVLEYLLRGTIYTYKKVDDIYIVGDGFAVRPENTEFAEVKRYTVQYLKADQLLNTLPPLFPRQNFTQLPDKNVVVLTAPPDIQAKFQEYLNQMDVENSDVRTAMIRIKHLKAEDVLKYFPAAIPKNDIIVIKELNALTVTGSQNLISQVQQYIETVDQVNPMIVFDIQVISISDTDKTEWNASGTLSVGDKSLAIAPETGSITLTNGTATTATATTLAALKLLVSQEKAKILQNPTISTLNGYPTNFKVSTKRSFQVESTQTVNGNVTTTQQQMVVDTGLYISINPWVSADKQITMEIKPTFSEYNDPPSTNMIAITVERTTESTIRVHDQQTVIISGLKYTSKDKKVYKMPVLGDIPGLGALFRRTFDQESQNEFVILITPHLIYDEAAKKAMNEKLSGSYDRDIRAEMGGGKDGE
jgi:type II secretory pathway component GspD/PulD (secretin)